MTRLLYALEPVGRGAIRSLGYGLGRLAHGRREASPKARARMPTAPEKARLSSGRGRLVLREKNGRAA